MGYLFIDIETYVDLQNRDSGLNPYEKESKVLTICFSYNSKFRLTLADLGPPTILKEWESSEEEILKRFYSFIKEKVETDEHLKLLGFNIQKFDIPYLFGRMMVKEIDLPKNLSNVFYKRVHVIDLGQLAMILSKKMQEKKEIFNVSFNEVSISLGMPSKTGNGLAVSKWYRDQEYDKIVKYIRQEFQFDKMYLTLRDYILGAFTKKNCTTLV